MQVDPTNYNYNEEAGFLADFDPGKDAGNELPPNRVGELAEAEIGTEESGTFRAYDIVTLGGIPEGHDSNTAAKVEGDLNDSDDSDLPTGAQCRLMLTDHNRDRRIQTTKWFKVSRIEDEDATKRPTLKFRGIEQSDWAKEGRVVLLQVRNPREKMTVDYDKSTFEFPYVGGY